MVKDFSGDVLSLSLLLGDSCVRYAKSNTLLLTATPTISYQKYFLRNCTVAILTTVPFNGCSTDLVFTFRGYISACW